MRVSCFDVRKAKFFSCCEWEREIRQFVDEQIRMITKVMPVTKQAFVFLKPRARRVAHDGNISFFAAHAFAPVATTGRRCGEYFLPPRPVPHNA